MIRLIITTVLFFLLAQNTLGQRKSTKEAMRAWQPMVGNWQAQCQMLPKGKPVIAETGTLQVRYVLDSAYLELHVQVRREDGKASRSYLQFITWNPDSAHYISTYFYNDWAERVTEYYTRSTDGSFNGTATIPMGSSRPPMKLRIRITPKGTNAFDLNSEELQADGTWYLDYSAAYTKQ